MGELKKLIKVLENCEKVCETCAAESLNNNEDVLSLEECIRIAWDCADFCHLAIKLLKRNSDRINEIIATCMEICLACATECEKHDLVSCQKCAAVCRLCANGCRNYLKKNWLAPDLA